MWDGGQHIFVDELARFAAATADLRVTDIAERAAEPVRVSVRGREGVGRGTVAGALGRAGRARGIQVAADWADVVAYVTAEVLKPEDREAISGLSTPVVAVLNKADLCGFAGAGPLAAAQARCVRLAGLIPGPLLPMVGSLAVAALEDLDDALWAALRALALHPGGAACLDGGYDGFLAVQLPVPAVVRVRLLEALDLFGIALAMAAVRRGGTLAQVRALLRRVSGVDAVVAGLVAAGAEARYRRVLRAVAELEALAVSVPAVGGFLTADDTVLARMAAAVDVVESGGLEVGPVAPLARALHWQRYSVDNASSPVRPLHRACAADIVRGSLRLWSAAGGTP